MRGAELIVAVNTDAGAPIFNIAHYGVVGDLFDVIPLLTEKLRAAAQG
jgi:electron transfer flavoprotein alpha subunit